jgi:Asp-tRNA(Asn)/Glu-tRNA(Gln) amidotransferase A subunit family amidase
LRASRRPPAITIVGVPLGGTPAASTGGGTLDALFEAAADLWEGATLDDHAVTIFYGWAALSPAFGAFESLQHEADGRATGGTIVVNNALFTSWFVDATPEADEEFGAFAEARADLGGGSMNVGRTFEAVAPDAALLVHRFMADFDAILSPTLGRPPVPLGTVSLLQPLVEFSAATAAFSCFTALQNQTGQPAMSVPLHWTDDGLPIGVQFAGRVGEEELLLALARQLEEARPWFHRRPPL